MKYLILILLGSLSFLSKGQNIETVKIYSEILNQERSLLIYKPLRYYTSTKRYEVIYVFDSQNREMFDLVHAAINFVSPQSNFIVVGIQSPYISLADKVYKRNHDMLTEALDEKTRKRYFGRNSNGNASNFRKHIKQEIFPFIENNYRTLPLRIASGHSNGATFISYCFLENAEMFDAYLIQSPNYAYDEEQFVNRFKEFDFNTITKQKFIFLSHANEAPSTGWRGWQEAREKVYPLLKNLPSDKINIEFKQYPDENHWDSYAKSCIDGLSSFIAFQFRTGENIISYNESLEKQGLVKLNAKKMDRMAYSCFINNKPKDAIQVIDWAIKRFPDDDNLYDSRGQYYESIGKKKQARASYSMAIEVLKKNQSSLSKEKFEKRLQSYQRKYNRVN